MENNRTKERSKDRILIIKKVDPKVPDSLVDVSNTLHAIMDDKTCLWSLKYSSGITPGPLKQQFTSFKALMNFTTGYFQRRGLQIAEVID